MKNGLFQTQAGGSCEHGISRDIEERSCGNSRGQLKKKCNFQGCSRKIHVEFPWVLTSKRNVEHNIFFIQEKVI